MKSILLYANEDIGLESRLQAALDVTRLFEGHLTCLQVSPYDSFIMGDPFGGIYALPTMIEQVRRTADEHRERIEPRLRGEGVSWDWLRYDGAPAQLLVDRGRLTDLIVLSLPGADPAAGARDIAADVLIHARSPVLAVPAAARGFDGLGQAMIAWDGSLEASHALRMALPMLRQAAGVNVVTIAQGHREFPATDASQYLSRHGIPSDLDERPAGSRTTAAALIEAAAALSAAYIVMGAYGHTRLREAVLGGATRDMLHDSPVPLLLAH